MERDASSASQFPAEKSEVPIRLKIAQWDSARPAREGALDRPAASEPESDSYTRYGQEKGISEEFWLGSMRHAQVQWHRHHCCPLANCRQMASHIGGVPLGAGSHA
jgi:hypothetical protein